MQSRQRIVLDEDINKSLKESEAGLNRVRLMYKRFAEKNRALISKAELNNRRKKIDLLTQNLAILDEEYEDKKFERE